MRNFRKVTKILGIILVIVIMSFMFMPEVNAENKEAKRNWNKRHCRCRKKIG